MELQQVTRPFNRMRYRTVGDFVYTPGIERINFIIAEMRNPDFEMLIFIHELVEAYLCWRRGLREEFITEFDKMFEEERKLGEHGKNDEPGDDPRSPYHREHKIASKFEKMLCKVMSIKWGRYSKAVDRIYEGK